MHDESSTQSDRSFAMLEFVGDGLEPSALLRLIALTPFRVSKKGEIHGKREPITSKTGVCMFSTIGVVPSADMNDHIAYLLAAASGRGAEIRQLVEDQQLTCGIVCFFEAGSRKARWALSAANEELSKSLAIAITNETDGATTRFVDNAS